MKDFLNINREGSILVLQMDHLESRNALTGNSAIAEIVGACEVVASDTTIKAVILTGSGGIFSSGGNVKDMHKYQRDRPLPEAICQEYRVGIQRIPKALYHLDVPTIAAVNGPAIGAGLDLACMCDIRIASTNATFAESFVKVGIVPGDGGAWLLPRAVGRAKAAEMAFTGDAISSAEALAFGLVSRVVSSELLLDTAFRIARKIAAQPAHVLRMTKRLLRAGEHGTLESVLETSASYQAIAHMSPDHHEAVNAFCEKRQPRFNE